MQLLKLTLPPLLAFSCLAQAEAADKFDKLMSQWITLESQKGQLEKDWKTRKRSLELQYNLLTSEETALKDVLAQSQSVKDNIESERIALLEKQNKLEKEQNSVKEEIKIAQVILHKLADQLPPPLQNETTDALSALGNTQFTNSNKLEKIVGLLDKVNAFQQRISLHQSSMKLPSPDGEKDILVKQIYLGLSQSWYVSADGKFYGYGQVYKGQWQWWHQEGATDHLQTKLNPEDILSAIHIVENPSSAKLLALPIKLQNPDVQLSQIKP